MSTPRHADPSDPLNGAKYHTGRLCIEKGCTRPAGTHWSPFWCQQCNSDRLSHISDVLERKLERMKEQATQETPDEHR